MTAGHDDRRVDRLAPERLVFFSDAVVAIAITLLVLPLVDLVSGTAGRGEPASAVVADHLSSIGSFALSFAVIARFWRVHHEMFDRVEAVGGPLVTVNLVWLATIAFLPFPTEMVGTYATNRFTEVLYIGTLLLSTACLGVMGLIVRADRTIAPEPGADGRRSVLSYLGPALTLIVALVLVATVDGLSYEVLLLLLVPAVIGGIQDRRRRRTAG